VHPRHADREYRVFTAEFFNGIGAKQTKEGNVLLVTGGRMNDVVAGKTMIASITLAVYEDAFGKNHVTMSCQTIQPPRGDYLVGPINQTMHGPDTDCPQYNCADKDCREYDNQPWMPGGISLEP
jgi:hypothetical protein